MKYRLLILFLCLFTTNLGWGQTSSIDKFRFIGFKIHAGKHFYTGNLLQEELKSGYQAIELRYGWQGQGKYDWEKAFNFPAYGFGIYSGHLGDINVIGHPLALFGFMSFSINDVNSRNVLMIEPALGLTFNLKPYQIESNPTNDAIGSKCGVYFNLNVGGRYLINREFDVTYGIDLTHISNGRISLPNHGFNMAGLNIGARYHFNAGKYTTTKDARPSNLVSGSPRHIRTGNILLYQALGKAQNYTDQGTNKGYLTSSTILEYEYRHSEMHGFSVGVDLFSDQGLKDTIVTPLYQTYQTTWMPGIHIGYGLVWWRFTAIMQGGYMVSEAGRKMKSPYFMRPALRFDFNNRLYTQVGLKSFRGTTADWIEFGIGLRLFRL